MKTAISSEAELDDLVGALETAARLRDENKMAFFRPYRKQAEFMQHGARKRERLLMAGNQVGKSECGAYELTCHLTGLYPPWWGGKRFRKAVKAWALGETSIVVRDVQQKKLCGEPGVDSAFGTGMIPKDLFVDKPSLARGVTDAFDTIQVRHAGGGVSICRFKSYEQGRAKLQGETIHVAWCDEEPPEDVYGEVLARLTGDGICYTTFTPLKGRSRVVLRFLEEAGADRQVITLPLADVTHFTAEEKARRVAGYAAHEREAREKGTPLLGSGNVYSFPPEMISEPQIQFVPPHWAKLWGIDFGIGHSFGYALAAIDRDNDCIHILHAAKMPDALPIQHAAAMKQVAANVPVAWPHDGTQRDKGSGEQLAVLYRRQGLAMLAEHATFETGGYSREAAVLEIQERAVSGRFKVASHLSEFWAEFGTYHRKDGIIVRVEDDVMSAIEKIVMAKRFARPVPLGSKVVKRRGGAIADGVDSGHWGID